MAPAKFTVRHFVASLEARVMPPAGVNNRYLLAGVSPVYRRPSAAPGIIPRLDLFTRFYVDRPGPVEFELEVTVRAGGRRIPVDTYGPYAVHFRPAEPVRDYVFRLLNVPAVAGLYRFRLRPIGRRRAVASEYLEVE